jgi:hypothetical protein
MNYIKLHAAATALCDNGLLELIETDEDTGRVTSR